MKSTSEIREVFDPSQGDFIVPDGARGIYDISFVAIIDTHNDNDDSLAPVHFVVVTELEGEPET